MRAFLLRLVCMGSLGKAKLHSVEQLLLCYCRGQPFNSMQRSKFLYAHQWAMVPHFSSADSPSLSHTHTSHHLSKSKHGNFHLSVQLSWLSSALQVKDHTGRMILGRSGLYTVQFIDLTSGLLLGRYA